MNSLNNSGDIAMAIPRVSPYGGSGIALPRPLPPSEAARIRRIFADQAKGNIADAISETSQMDQSTPLGKAMLGHILADRYLGRFTRPAAPELQDWLTNWADLPDAPAIHTLLLARLPASAKVPPAPVAASLPDDPPSAPVPEETEAFGATLKRQPALDHAVFEAVRAGRVSAAAQMIVRAGISPGYATQLRGEAARILFTLNRDEDAYVLAAPAMYACGRDPDCQISALPLYIAGLAAWRMDQPDVARPMFEAAWRAQLTTSALKAGAAFWAARAHQRTLDWAAYVPWMMKATEQHSTFYGILARRNLGLAYELATGERETLGEADVAAVAATPEGTLAFALLQVGQTTRADAELRRLWPQAKTTPELGRSIMLVASSAGLADLASQLADLVQTADGRPREPTRFPVPNLQPNGGFTVDPAMLYALARTESNFDNAMVSSAGARGMLQIMPETAQFVLQTSGGSHGTLYDPSVNLDLGQRYIDYLGTHEVNGDLIRLLASYNSGPANFARWQAQIQDHGDPLLFMEAIPVDETRAFVPRVLTYTWIYAARLRLPAPSLDELAAGQWPRYHSLAPAPAPSKPAVIARLN